MDLLDDKDAILASDRDLLFANEEAQLMHVMNTIDKVDYSHTSRNSVYNIKCLTCDEQFNNAFNKCEQCIKARQNYVNVLKYTRSFYSYIKLYGRYLPYYKHHDMSKLAYYADKSIYAKRLINIHFKKKRNKICDHLNLYVLHMRGVIDERFLIPEILKYMYGD